MECEFPKFNADLDQIKIVLKSSKTIAVVGISQKEERPSHWIAKYLKDNGYMVYGVHPSLKELWGEKIYKNLSEIPEPIDIVNIFLNPDLVGPVVDEAIKIKAKVIWMQEGIVNNQAAERARDAGLTVVMNKCIFKVHQFLNL
jgi:predicted CoA-binding protein